MNLKHKFNILMVVLFITVLCLWLIIIATLKVVDFSVTASLVGVACGLLLVLSLCMFCNSYTISNDPTRPSDQQIVENNNRICMNDSNYCDPNDLPPSYDTAVADTNLNNRLQELGLF